ncbi:hypothetical protein C7D74_27350 [Klebsiella pneumoniae]|nr:hypothetical protein C7D74_27350 [Klebsiella pneumoniae]
MGPTIRVWNGDDVKLIYSNRLTENVAMTIPTGRLPPAPAPPSGGSMAAIWGRRSASGTETTSSLSTATA